MANDYGRMTLQDWERVHRFIFDLTDPDKYALSLRDPEIGRRAIEMLALFERCDSSAKS